VGKSKAKRPLRRTKRRWVNNIKEELSEIGWCVMDWIDLAHDRDHWRALVITIMNLRVSQNAGNFSNSCTTGGFSSRAQLHEVSLLSIKSGCKYF
jgi:hypothetical protein